jgi:ATP-dependent exoDNAse (exonuclease V) alpha subunit
VEKGIAEIRGIDERVRRHFSRRRAEIVQRMSERGGRSARSAEIATLETRRTKTYNLPVGRMREEWRARAAELGLGREELASLTHRVVGHRRIDAETVAETLEAPSGLTERTSAFDRRDVVRAWAEAHGDGASAKEIEQLADAWLTRSSIVRLDRGQTRRQLGGARFSTEELLRIETRLLDGAAARQHSGIAQVDTAIADRALAADDSLSDEQRHLVQRVTTSGCGVEIVRAAAGTGKTRALAAARDIWEAAGTPVYGCAVAARAAVELEQTAGIDSATISRLLADLDHGYGLTPGSVLVVDEAGMAGTRALARLADHAAATESKLQHVGDDHQLPEIDAGGAFRALAERLGAAELREVHRQTHGWDREALRDLRAGRIDAWATTYRDQGRLAARPTAAALREALVDDWWESARARAGDAVMIAHRRSDVAELSATARARMQRDGRLGDEQVTTDRRSVAVGDCVIARRNDRRRQVVNGTRAEVIGLDVERRSLKLRTDAGDEREIDAAYLDAGRLEHGYALTAHAAQGATVDRAFVLGGDALYREWGYTAMTCHRGSATFYLVSPGSTERALPGLEDGDALMDDIRESLNATRRQSTASEVAAADASRETQERVARLAEERSSLRFWNRGCRAELDDLIARQEEALERYASLPATSRTTPAPRRTPIDPERARIETLAPTRATLEAFGPRPSPVADRERWVRAVAQLVGSSADAPDREIPTAHAHTMDYDTGLEL